MEVVRESTGEGGGVNKDSVRGEGRRDRVGWGEEGESGEGGGRDFKLV